MVELQFFMILEASSVDWMLYFLLLTFLLVYVLQLDSNHPISSPWNAIRSHWVYLWSWYVQNGLNSWGFSVWCWSLCWRWHKRTNWNRACTCRVSGQVYGCNSEKAGSDLRTFSWIQIFTHWYTYLWFCHVFIDLSCFFVLGFGISSCCGWKRKMCPFLGVFWLLSISWLVFLLL